MKRLAGIFFLQLVFVGANIAAPVAARNLSGMAFTKAGPPSGGPNTVVAVHLQSPDFTVRELKYRVFYNKGEVKHIPMAGYDFKTAFTDELMNALAEEKRMAW